MEIIVETLAEGLAKRIMADRAETWESLKRQAANDSTQVSILQWFEKLYVKDGKLIEVLYEGFYPRKRYFY